MGYNPRVSVVDYMNSKKMNSSFSSRAKLANQYGIRNYKGTASQNTALLGYLSKPKPAPKPVAKKPVVPKKPVMTAAEKAFYDSYTKQIGAGQNNTARMTHYNNIVKKYGLKAGTVGSNTLRGLSQKALAGDSKAAAYLKAMGLKGVTGKDLWSGYDAKDIASQNNAFRQQYLKDNPYSAYAKEYDMRHYGIYNDWIKNNKQMTDSQIKWYQNMIKKWNLDDMNDPFIQQQAQLEADKQGALKAQDVALNQGLGAQDATNFQQFQQIQQMMADKGMSESGIAADTYMRAQMGANQNYQQAFADSAVTKTDITAQFNDAIANSKIGKQEYEAGLAQSEKENQLAQQKLDLDFMKMQTDQDKYLTTSTGYVYLNGKMLTSGGKPLTSLEYKKLSETQRHNLATENNIAIKNAQDYALGKDSNAIKREQIAADIQTTMAKLKLDYAKLDYNYAKLEANNAIQQEKIKIAADNAQTSATKSQLSGLGKQLDNVTKQITAYQKKGKKPPKDLVEKYNSLQNQISSLVGGSDFMGAAEGGMPLAGLIP